MCVKTSNTFFRNINRQSSVGSICMHVRYLVFVHVFAHSSGQLAVRAASPGVLLCLIGDICVWSQRWRKTVICPLPVTLRRKHTSGIYLCEKIHN